MSYTDTDTGQDIEGRAVILKTTDGEVVVDPVRIFGDDALAKRLDDIEARVSELEAAATSPQAPAEPGA